MYQLKSLEDTIVAIATAVGSGGIGIVRLSGRQAVGIADQLFISRKNKKPAEFANYTAHYGWIVKNLRAGADISELQEEIVDEVLLTVMRAPKSYTREDVVEISCHGGVVALRTILHLALDCGARLAEPGEFTKRAFLNGRIDLTQAEAVLDIIQSKTETFLRVSTHQLKGELFCELELIREDLLNVYTEIEAIINFPEDDLDTRGREVLRERLAAAKKRVDQLLHTADQGKILKDGIKIVLCGKPNVGKSSLLNVLLRQPRAIVSDIAGTTRDTIEETAQIRGIPFQLVDTAGILEPRDLIEEEAIKRSRLSINSADLVVLLLDGSHKISQEDEQLIERIRHQNVLVAVNKSDLPYKIEEDKIQKILKHKPLLKISALHKAGIAELEQAIVEHVWHGKIEAPTGLIVSNVRHIHSLKECSKSLDKALEIFSEEISWEFISEETKSAVNALDSVTGRNIDHDLLDKIFAQFCIGK
ncbi:MAG: tRNA uridine-5-carboxymethylaminomethyl(34) synthesis GTPase MnmE [Omnitrophica WOR_2 bacterium RIFCSPHIGHO2_01_FULL_48_9]|nr:MAG: tRNA uridine-5-carboxymethylaminomethyl(34) synthesis GTPase MnmE [Omnitrophica WOR_2 bacterium RIFCSPHIGHO2_02_FULL_48_11]OGX29913.1 MAG: tRNA uridine-5-carboxymethylaminomethyl(34) synthesis GTPase MnmE [Omnitrophica WOR_2 bacterium RIFCSPHIGHO2_01_FULL_48_9]